MLKITILENNLKNTDNVHLGIEQAVVVLNNIGYQPVIDYKVTNVNLIAEPISTDVVQHGFVVGSQPILDSVDGSADVACMIYDWSKVPPFDWSSTKPLNPCSIGIKKGNTTPTQIPEEWYGDPIEYPEVLKEFFLHELCHDVYFLVGQAHFDMTHHQFDPSWNGKFNSSTPTDYYVFLLTGLLYLWNQYKGTQVVPPPTPFSPYKYFKLSEVNKLQPTFIQMLDTARGISNTPYKITSGFRTLLQNTSVGGVPNSAHLRGLAADIACTDATRQSILRGLLTCGTPVFIEDAKLHVHVDIDSSIHQLGYGIVSELD